MHTRRENSVGEETSWLSRGEITEQRARRACFAGAWPDSLLTVPRIPALTIRSGSDQTRFRCRPWLSWYAPRFQNCRSSMKEKPRLTSFFSAG